MTRGDLPVLKISLFALWDSLPTPHPDNTS